MRKVPALVLLMLALALAGCGSDEGKSPAERSGNFGCLSPAEVEAEVNAIAEGAEGSPEEVEAKQDEIAAIRAEEC